MKSLIALSFFLATAAHAELNAKDLKQCAPMGGDKSSLFTLNGQDKNVRYKFDGNDVYKITIPQGASVFSIPLKSAKGACFSRVSDAAVEISTCPKAASLEKLSGVKLNEPFEAIMNQYTLQLQGLLEDAKENGSDNPEAGDVRAYVSMFKSCRTLGPISQKYAQPLFERAA